MHFIDKGTRGKVLGLRVRCSKDGCDWEGDPELGDLEKHLSNKCFYVEEVCPHGCGQLYPRHLLQTHQLDECPQRPLEVKLEILQRQLQQHLVHQEKKHDQDKKELQQQLAQQEKKHEEDKKELQQQLVQQEKKHEEDKKELQQQLVQQEKKREEDKKELQQQLVQQEKKHKDLQQYQEQKHDQDKKELQQQLEQQKKEHKELQLSLIQQLTGTNNALTLCPVGSIGPCDVSVR